MPDFMAFDSWGRKCNRIIHTYNQFVKHAVHGSEPVIPSYLQLTRWTSDQRPNTDGQYAAQVQRI